MSGDAASMDVATAVGLGKDYVVGPRRRRVHTALVDISFTIPRGSVFGLIGPNGAGKSTTLHLMVGFFSPTRGEVTLFGMPPSLPEARRELGFLPEVFAYDRFSTGRRLLERFDALSGRSPGGRDERVLDALFAVDMATEASRRVGAYSKGLTQRIGLAQAVLGDPELLILDEPMSGMDPATRHAVKDLVKGRRARGKTTLFSSHILADVEDLADRILVLREGKALYEGPVSGLGERSGVTIMARFDQEPAPGLIPPGSGMLQPSAAHPGIRVMDVASPAEVNAALRLLMDAGATIVSVSPRHETLESRFLDLVSPRRHPATPAPAPPPPPPGESA